MEGLTGQAGQWMLWLFVAQVIGGGANVLFGFPLVLNTLHLALAAAVWGAAVVLWASTRVEFGIGWLGAQAE